METGMKMIMDLVTNLTKIFVAFIGFGVVAGIVFGGNAFLVGDVLENLLGVVSMLGVDRCFGPKSCGTRAPACRMG